MVKWGGLQADIERYLKKDPTCYVTLLIDYYGIEAKHGLPRWEDSLKIPYKDKRMDFLEAAMRDNILPAYSHRFIPYIQLHEFEGLLFSDPEVFNRAFEVSEFQDYEYLQETLKTYNNPEDINDNILTAPSKRLERILRDYSSQKRSNTKAFFGPMIAGEIGLLKIREKCPRFNDWITKLEQL